MPEPQTPQPQPGLPITVGAYSFPRERWLKALHDGHAALAIDPHDQDALEAIDLASQAIAQDPAKAPQASAGAELLQVGSGLASAAGDIPRGIGHALTHPMETLGQLTGVGNWGEAVDTFKNPEAGWEEKLSSLVQSTPANIGYAPTRALRDASDADAGTEELAHRAGNVASLALLGLKPGAIGGTAKAVGGKLMKPINAAKATLDIPILKAQELQARAALIKARQSALEAGAGERAGRAPDLARAAKARAGINEASLARQPTIDATATARSGIADATLARQPAMDVGLNTRNITALEQLDQLKQRGPAQARTAEAGAGVEEANLGRQPEITTNWELRNDMLRAQLQRMIGEDGGAPSTASTPSPTPVGATSQTTPQTPSMQRMAASAQPVADAPMAPNGQPYGISVEGPPTPPVPAGQPNPWADIQQPQTPAPTVPPNWIGTSLESITPEALSKTKVIGEAAPKFEEGLPSISPSRLVGPKMAETDIEAFIQSILKTHKRGYYQ